MRGLSRTTKVLIAVGVACSILILLNMLELRNIKEPGPAPQNLKANKAKQPKFVVYTKDVSL